MKALPSLSLSPSSEPCWSGCCEGCCQIALSSMPKDPGRRRRPKKWRRPFRRRRQPSGLRAEPAENGAAVEAEGFGEAPAGESAIPYARLAQAGINVELGLNYCGGDEDFFREMLRMFHAQSGEKKAEILALYEQANWPDYAVKVHALKSTSLTIGAETLSAQAKWEFA